MLDGYKVVTNQSFHPRVQARRDNRFGTAINYDQENVFRTPIFVLRITFTGIMFHVHLVASGKLLEISTLRDMTKAHLTLGELLREEQQTSKKFN